MISLESTDPNFKKTINSYGIDPNKLQKHTFAEGISNETPQQFIGRMLGQTAPLPVPEPPLTNEQREQLKQQNYSAISQGGGAIKYLSPEGEKILTKGKDGQLQYLTPDQAKTQGINIDYLPVTGTLESANPNSTFGQFFSNNSTPQNTVNLNPQETQAFENFANSVLQGGFLQSGRGVPAIPANP